MMFIILYHHTRVQYGRLKLPGPAVYRSRLMLMIQYVYSTTMSWCWLSFCNSIAKSATRTTFWFVVGFCCDFPKRAPRGGARQINVIILKFLKKTKAAPELLSPELKNILSTVARTVLYRTALYCTVLHFF